MGQNNCSDSMCDKIGTCVPLAELFLLFFALVCRERFHHDSRVNAAVAAGAWRFDGGSCGISRTHLVQLLHPHRGILLPDPSEIVSSGRMVH